MLSATRNYHDGIITNIGNGILSKIWNRDRNANGKIGIKLFGKN